MESLVRTLSVLKFNNQSGKSLGCLPIIGLLLLTIVLTIGGTVWAIQSGFFTRNFKPVELSNKEELSLQQKLDALSSTSSPTNQASQDLVSTDGALPDSPGANDDNIELKPELYTEDDSKRRIELTQRELNALLAKNTDLAENIVVHLSKDTASVRVLADIDPDFPFFGGKKFKASGAAQLSYENGRPVIVVKGVSIWGVPISNSWLGGYKNIDLVREFGGTEGFWKSLADGIKDIKVEDGSLFIQLAE